MFCIQTTNINITLILYFCAFIITHTSMFMFVFHFKITDQTQNITQGKSIDYSNTGDVTEWVSGEHGKYYDSMLQVAGECVPFDKLK